MARTTQEIYQGMVAQKEATPELNALTSTSATAIWRLIFYVVAYAINVLETLWDAYQSRVTEEVEAKMPHRARWYRDKALLFMEDKTLATDADYYDTTGMTEEEIEAARIVKYAACSERAASSKLDIKIAGVDQSGNRCPIPAAAQTQFEAYMSQVKDAGVRFQVWNQAADNYKCSVTIVYDATRLPAEVEAACEAAMREYVENLPFNGLYSDMGMVDALRKVDGVRIVSMLQSMTAQAGGSEYTGINGYTQPVAGYFHFVSATITMEAYNL